MPDLQSNHLPVRRLPVSIPLAAVVGIGIGAAVSIAWWRDRMAQPDIDRATALRLKTGDIA